MSIFANPPAVLKPVEYLQRYVERLENTVSLLTANIRTCEQDLISARAERETTLTVLAMTKETLALIELAALTETPPAP